MNINRYKILKSSKEGDLVLDKLRAYLDKNEPQFVRFLQKVWDKQAKDISYKELREAILSGELSKEILNQWMEDYSLFVEEYLLNFYFSAILEATQKLKQKYPEFYLDLLSEGVQEWSNNKSAKFVTNITDSQIKGLKSVIMKASQLEDSSVDDLSRVIRPMIGLTQQQSKANLRYYQTMLSNKVPKKKALENSLNYSFKQHRYRAMNIARTELVFAYNQGSFFCTKKAQEQKFLGSCSKQWCTALDERVCSICGGLDNKQIEMEEDFDFKTKIKDRDIKKVPPAHPGCRCAVIFVETKPPAVEVLQDN